MSFAFQQDATLPNDAQGLRTGFFHGLAEGVERMGWFEPFEDGASYAFLWGVGGILIADTAVTGRTILLPLIRDAKREYKVDFEALSAYSMTISAQKLHRLSTRAMELGELRTALTLYSLAAQLAPAYRRLKELVWDHPIVGSIVTPERKEDLQAEYAYTVLARDMVATLTEDPKFAAPSVDLGSFLRETFRGYERLLDTELEEGDCARLAALDDGALRQRLAKLLLGVDPVEAEREARKPHTSAEIADMEVLVRHENELFHLLMPVKSGREISGKSVPVEVFYQILRPHLFFEKGVVVFITAKPCSQLLHNYMKQARDRLGWPIGVVENHDLARLFKLNGLL